MKDLKIESLIPKFAAERIEPENTSKRVVRCRACTSWCNYDQDRHRLRALCAAALSERVPFSADVVAAVEGVDVVRKEKFLRRELDVNFRLFSQPSSI